MNQPECKVCEEHCGKRSRRCEAEQRAHSDLQQIAAVAKAYLDYLGQKEPLATDRQRAQARRATQSMTRAFDRNFAATEARHAR